MKKAQEKKLDVAEIRMLRWMSGVTKPCIIRNEKNIGTTKVGDQERLVGERIVKRGSARPSSMDASHKKNIDPT